MVINTNLSGYTFRADGRYFILAERHKSKDTLGLYDTTESYKLARVRRNRPFNHIHSYSRFSSFRYRRHHCLPFACRQPVTTLPYGKGRSR